MLRSTRKILAPVAIVCSATLLLTGMTLVAAQDESAEPMATTPKEISAAQKQFNQLKTLAGEWVMLDENGEMTDQVASRFSVTAGGSAILDIEFPGTENEMITLYHLDGDELIMTHYCMLGNQPHMKAVASDDVKTIHFECTGEGTNMASENDRHMHDGTFTFLSEDRISSIWNMHHEGQAMYTAEFKLARRHNQ